MAPVTWKRGTNGIKTYVCHSLVSEFEEFRLCSDGFWKADAFATLIGRANLSQASTCFYSVTN